MRLKGHHTGALTAQTCIHIPELLACATLILAWLLMALVFLLKKIGRCQRVEAFWLFLFLILQRSLIPWHFQDVATSAFFLPTSTMTANHQTAVTTALVTPMLHHSLLLSSPLPFLRPLSISHLFPPAHCYIPLLKEFPSLSSLV